MPIPCESCPARLPRLNDRRLISLPVPHYPSDEYSLNKTVQRLSIKAMATFHVNSCLCYVFVVFYAARRAREVNKDAGISYCGGVKAG